MSQTVRAGVYRARHRVEAAEVEVADPAPGEVLLRVEACGICGSDLHVYDEEPGRTPAGITLGHEFCGLVEAIGEGVVDWRAGDRVTVEPLLSCGHCELCRRGLDALCRQYRLIGMDVPGGLAERVVVPSHRLYRVPAEMPAPLAALAEPVAVVVHALDLGGPTRGQDVLVLGAGTLGLLAVAIARGRGAARIRVTARHPHQAELARELGADEVIPSESAAEVLDTAEAAARPPGLVIETVGGAADTLDLAAAAVAPAGTVVVLGVFTRRLRLDPFPLLFKEVTLRWSLCYSRGGARADFAEALRLLEEDGDALGRVLTHEVPLARVDEAFALAADKTRGVVKVTVRP